MKAGEAAVMSGRGVWCTVTVARGDRRRPTLRAYMCSSLPNFCKAPSERWLLEFDNATQAERWLDANRNAVGGKRLLTAPLSQLEGGERVMNLVTFGRVDPHLLYEFLGAEWIDQVGELDGRFEYRFSSEVPFQTLGERLYALNRVFKVGKKKGGAQLTNTFLRLKDDEGHYMHLRANLASHARPTVQVSRVLSERRPRRGWKVGRWFSVHGIGKATQGSLLQWANWFAPKAKVKGVEWGQPHPTLWLCVHDQEEVKKCGERQLVPLSGRPPLVVRARKAPPPQWERLRPASDPNLEESLAAIEEKFPTPGPKIHAVAQRIIDERKPPSVRSYWIRRCYIFKQSMS